LAPFRCQHQARSTTAYLQRRAEKELVPCKDIEALQSSNTFLVSEMEKLKKELEEAKSRLKTSEDQLPPSESSLQRLVY